MKLPAWLLPVVLLLALGAGLLTLLRQRLDEGSSYEPYSTFRADPFGAKGLYLALAELPGRPLQVERSFRPLSRLARGPDGSEPDLTGTTVLLLGESPQQWASFPPASRMKAIEQVARRGGRVVLAFAPTKTTPVRYVFSRTEETQVGPSPSPSPSPSPAKRPRRDEDERPPTAEERRGRVEPPASSKAIMGEAWGVALVTETRRPGQTPKPTRDDDEVRQEDTYAPLPAIPDPAAGAGRESLPWLSVLDFQLSESETPLWRAVFSRARKPAIIEREFGRGTLVLCSDAFFLSNEALYRERYPAALNWLLGRDARRVVFDEHYLGTAEDPGIMALANRFGLTGAVLGFVFLALLYVWRNASPLVPPPPDPGHEGAPPQPGLGAEAGFPSLLRRAIAAPALARFVFEQWRSSPTGQELRAAPTPARVAELEQVLGTLEPAQKKDPARVYREMRARLGLRPRSHR